MLSVITDGGIILSRVVNDKQALSRQIMLYREFIRAIFLGSLMSANDRFWHLADIGADPEACPLSGVKDIPDL